MNQMIRASLWLPCLALAAPADAAVRYFDFSVGGFTDGATLTGSFAGEDTNGDGTLITLASQGFAEITDFTAHFSGNSLIAAQDWTYAEFSNGSSGLLYAFGPTLNGTGGHFGQEGIVAFNLGGFIIAGGPAALGNICNGSNVCFEIATTTGGFHALDTTFSLSSVTEIQAPASAPEPASWAMMIGGFGMIGAAMRRRRTSLSFG